MHTRYLPILCIGIIPSYVLDCKLLHNSAIDKVFLYGSYAKGTQRKDSDIDLCFFSEAFESRRSLDVLTDLFYLKIKYDQYALIEPNVFPVSELYSDNPFVKEILRTGREL